MKRDVGNMGEKHFSSLCSAAGITANKSEIDNKGWDYIVEFPFEFTTKYTDLMKTPIKCLVQVKSTDDAKCSSWSIKLNNLLYFCKTPLPAFFCLIKFNGKDSPQSISLLHMDQSLIKEVLKAARKNDVETKKIKTKTIYFKKEHVLKEISGKELKNAIEKYIPTGMNIYVKEKNNFVEQTGYEDGGAHFRIMVNPSELRDALLGIKNEISFDNFQLFDKRFDIISKKPNIILDIGTLKAAPESQGEVVWMFSQKKYGTEIKIKFQRYLSSLDAHLPFKQRKFRLKSSFIEVIFQFSKINLDYSIENKDEKFNIGELNKYCELLTMLKEKKEIYVSIFHDNEVKHLFSIPPSDNYKFEYYFSIFDVVHKYYKILEKYGLHNDVSINLNQIITNADNIDYFYMLTISNERFSYKIILESLNEEFIYKNILPDQKIAGVVSISTIIETHKYICIFAVIAGSITLNSEEKKYELLSEKTGYHKFLRFPLKESSNKNLDCYFDEVMKNISLDEILPIRIIEGNNSP